MSHSKESFYDLALLQTALYVTTTVINDQALLFPEIFDKFLQLTSNLVVSLFPRQSFLPTLVAPLVSSYPPLVYTGSLGGSTAQTRMPYFRTHLMQTESIPNPRNKLYHTEWRTA